MEKYSFEKAQDEAVEIQKKVKSGYVSKYGNTPRQMIDDAEQMIDTENNNVETNKRILVSVEELIPGIKPKPEPDELKKNNRTGYAADTAYARYFFNSNFTGHFLQEQNSEKLSAVLTLLSQCKNNDEWKKLIAEKKSENNDIWESMEFASKKDIAGFALSQMKDEIVIDLGCGEGKWYDYFSIAGAKGYVGVDMHLKHLTNVRETRYKLYKDIDKHIKNQAKKRNISEAKAIPANLNYEDMLSFLKRLPDNSVSIFTSGIDGNIMAGNTEYVEEISKEIERVLSSKGTYLSYESCFNPSGLVDQVKILRSSDENDYGQRVAIYTKQEKQMAQSDMEFKKEI